MSIYVRVKREKLTVFLHVEATDTIAMLKSKLQELLQKPSEDQQLYKSGVLLEDGRTLAELKVENDDELAVAFRLPGGQFDDPSIERFDSAHREDAS